ncbi:MAG: hypothetical protein ACRDXX_13675 [Stackebrandtia sp.]
MSSVESFFDRGQAELRAGEIHVDGPPGAGGPRFGISAVLRPEGEIVDRLTELGRQAAAIAGGGHWVHDGRMLHTTLRCLEAHSARDLDGDARLARYAAALDEAAAATPAIELELRGLAAHKGGVMAMGHDSSEAFPRLRKIYVDALDARGVEHYERSFTRDLWYLSLLHFGAPVPDPAALADWAASRRDQRIGSVVYRSVQICGWRLVDGSMIARILHEAKLSG